MTNVNLKIYGVAKMENALRRNAGQLALKRKEQVGKIDMESTCQKNLKNAEQFMVSRFAVHGIGS